MSTPANLTEDSTQPRSSAERYAKAFYIFGGLFLFGIFVFQLWFHIVRTSATIDEAPHILAGYRHLQCGDFGINPEHPPLLKMLAAVPLMSKDLIQPDWECGSKPTSIYKASQAGTFFLAKNNPENTVIPPRIFAASMSLLLAVLVFSGAAEMFGRWEAMTALALFVFEPNIIAHGSLVTTDMALTAMMFASIYALYRYLKRPSVFRLLLVGIAVGLTLASKHSGILILPILLVILIADLILTRKTEGETPIFRRFFQRAAAFAGIFLIGLTVLWAAYGFRYDALPNDSQEPVLLKGLFESVPPEVTETFKIKTLSAVTVIFPEAYTYGFFDIMFSSSRPMFLFGKTYPSGRWFYFPAAFTVKSSVALLVLLALSLTAFGLYRTKKRELLYLSLPALIFLAVSMNASLNIGVRHILPVYPFFILIAAAAACFLSAKYKIVKYGVLGLLIFHAFTAYRTAPDHLAFCNDFWGGVNNTHQFLDDSNVEWSQNFKLVNEYIERKNIKDCWIAPFGNGDLVRAYQPCRLMPNDFGWNFSEQIAGAVPPTVEGTFFLSSAAFPPHSGGNEYEPFLQAKPVDLIGGSVFVYQGRFEIPLVAALSHAGRADQLMEADKIDEAVTEGRKAVELAPDDARLHLALAISLKSAGKMDEARREFEETIRLAELNPTPLVEWSAGRAQYELDMMK
ncbi:MAG: glycosyltransferase family 39 protein [Pyrinomonadaceae bacterium]|nr:glycosyltransferase family 39 protein [Pyrinomonadaceae bacterium]